MKCLKRVQSSSESDDMPLFGQKGPRAKKKQSTKPRKQSDDKLKVTESGSFSSGSSMGEAATQKLIFHVQEAQGSATETVSDFTNVQELYQKIATSFNFPPSDILFCTLNTHRIDMENLLSSQLCLQDFIFVHRKGVKKEIEVTKSEGALGLTITDNGTGVAFIKRIRKGSLVDGIPVIQIGDHIEAINGTSLVGKRHVEVARMLKEIPVGATFVLRLIEPLRSGFVNIGSKSEQTKGQRSYGSGAETLRFKSKGPARLELAPDEKTKLAVGKINDLLDNFLGISDLDLAQEIWEMAAGVKNTMEFAEKLDNSELDSFGFTDDFLIDVWGILLDVKDGRFDKESKSSDSNCLDTEFANFGIS